jgi:hypothetical protein
MTCPARLLPVVFIACCLSEIAVAQTTRLSFTSDDFVVTPVFNNVDRFSFDIEIEAGLSPGVYTNPDIVRVDYEVSGELMNTPSGFPAFALERSMDGTEFYGQGSSLSFEISADAVLTDGVQAGELAGAGAVFVFNGREIGNGRFHPALLELNADGTGSVRNSDNIISEDPFQQVDFGEEYVTDLSFDAGNLTLLTEIQLPPSGGGGGGVFSWVELVILLLLTTIPVLRKEAA